MAKDRAKEKDNDSDDGPMRKGCCLVIVIVIIIAAVLIGNSTYVSSFKTTDNGTYYMFNSAYIKLYVSSTWWFNSEVKLQIKLYDQNNVLLLEEIHRFQTYKGEKIEKSFTLHASSRPVRYEAKVLGMFG